MAPAPNDAPGPAPEEVRTGCPYCGVGCGLIATVAAGRLTAVRGDGAHPVNRGRTCPKPLALPEASRSPDRAVTPLWREDRAGRFTPRRWDETLAGLAERLTAIRRAHGPDSIAFYLSGQLLTEDYYAAAKLVKGFLGTNNLDSNSRLCMSSAVAAYSATFGADGPPPSYADIEQADCFLLLGSNAAACHPIVWARIRERQAAGARIIVVDPRRTETAGGADLHLQLRPGTDVVLLNALLAEVARAGLVDEAYLAAHTSGHAETLAAAAEWTPERAEAICGVPAADISRAAHAFAGAAGGLALWSMGANQSTQGTEINQGLLNLCLASGQIGRPGAGPFSLTGQPNAMGGREVGGLAHLLPGYRRVADPADRAEMNARWRVPADAAGVSATPGLPATDLFDALEDGRIKAVWIVATNPLVSLPDAARARAALARAELVVCQDAYDPTETSAAAHVVLPAAQWPEKQGTMTNSERRVTLVRRAIAPPGDALPDWEIFARLGAALGWGEHFAWRDAAEVHAEFAGLTAGRPCDQAGISHTRLEREGSLQWPCPDPAHPGTARLYEDGQFPTSDGRARLAATVPGELPEPVSPDFPLLLTTGRIASQWHTMTRTGKSRRLLAAEPEPFIELHPADAAAAGIADGEPARVSSARGEAILRARVLDTVSQGMAFAPFHWGALHAPAGAGTVNDLSHRASDPVSRQPALKAIAVRVEPVGVGAAGVAATAEAVSERRRPGRAAGPRAGGRTRRGRRLVIVGTGPAGVATAESVIANAPAGDWQITLVGREPGLPYNRVSLSHRLSGASSEADLRLRERDWYVGHNVTLRVGDEVVALDPTRRVARTRTGTELDYDALVLATGSRPLLPPIPGTDLDGVFAFRTQQDVRAILARARRARRVAVIGGGLLGLEAARGLAQRGLDVTVVHLVDRLMERQLDGPAAGLVQRALRRLGISVLTQRATSEILGQRRVRGLRFAWGEDLAADMVVIAAGIRPDVALAQESGLEVSRGIVVDDAMRTSAAGVWAVGECAEHRGEIQGLWAPIRRQAQVAGATVAGVPAAFHGAVGATRLKVAEIDLFCAGVPTAEVDADDEFVFMDSRRGIYRKLVVRGDRLLGAILLGDTTSAQRLTELLRTGAPVPEALLCPPVGGAEALAGGGSGAGEADLGPDALVCSCNAVSQREIADAVARDGLTSVEAVGRATRAGTGCGTCRGQIAALLGGAAVRVTR
jgi:ferredoxin-nitrate reductase